MSKVSSRREALRTSPRFTELVDLAASPLGALKLTRGLVNRNNFCYINSCVQCLVHCEPFAQVMLHGEHESTSARFCALCTMRRVTVDILQEKNEPSEAIEFGWNSEVLNPEFKFSTQQDTHEFLTCVISRMVAEETRGCGRADGSAQQDSNELAESLVEKVFSFTTRTTITCSKCGTISKTEENCRDLCLKIAKPSKEEIKSVGEALQYYFGTEELDGENAYMCSTCNERVKAIKRISLQEGPNVLVICLARFLVELDETREAVISRKLNHFVKFTKKLDVSPYMHDVTTNEELKFGEHQYQLTAFLYHVGQTTNEGHYISNVFLPALYREGEIRPWLMKSDEIVQHIDFNKEAKAYLLFYTREDTQPVELPGMKKKENENYKRKKNKTVGIEEAKGLGKGKKVEPTKRVFLFPKIDIPIGKEWDC